VFLARYYSSDQMNENEMSWACGTYWAGGGGCIQGFGEET
jgi:hypothetical protein